MSKIAVMVLTFGHRVKTRTGHCRFAQLVEGLGTGAVRSMSFVWCAAADLMRRITNSMADPRWNGQGSSHTMTHLRCTSQKDVPHE
jgi:hypothetical protein